MHIEFAPPRPQPDLHLAPYHLWEGGTPEASVQFFRAGPATYLVRFPGAADFEIGMNGSAICRPVEGCEQAVLDHLWHNQVRPLLATPSGGLTLHASAVQVGTQCIAFLGASGLGKSTLAASFASAGFPLVCDDGLALVDLHDGWRAQPAPATVRLNPDSLAALRPDAGDSDAPRITRKHVLGPDHLPHCAQPLPLACLYVLGPGRTHELRRADAAAALIEVVRHTFLLDPEDARVVSARFEASARLVSRVPCWHLDFDRDFSALPAVRARVVDHARSQQHAAPHAVPAHS